MATIDDIIATLPEAGQRHVRTALADPQTKSAVTSILSTSNPGQALVDQAEKDIVEAVMPTGKLIVFKEIADAGARLLYEAAQTIQAVSQGSGVAGLDWSVLGVSMAGALLPAVGGALSGTVGDILKNVGSGITSGLESILKQSSTPPKPATAPTTQQPQQQVVASGASAGVPSWVWLAGAGVVGIALFAAMRR